VAGYHVVNILMHIATGIILFYFLNITLKLLQFQNLQLKIRKGTIQNNDNFNIYNFISSSITTPQHSVNPTPTDIVFISFFTTFIWLVHPIQTQTVSYIVQRMNCMAAMFYILSLFLYVKARLSNTKIRKLLLFSGCTLSGILALTSKEIAATLPFFIFLYEWYFIQDLSLKWLKRNLIYLLCFLFVVVLLSLLYLGGNPIEKILSLYSYRNFTLGQRVLTEFRVVIYYISLIIFPHPIRLNFLHDFTISYSLINPITTIISIIAITGLLILAICLAKRERLLSFCILWFMGNLVIESSVISLEILYEHRNYLPSMFLLLILVVSIRRFINSKWLGGVLLCAVAIILSVWTYQRNLVWSDDVTFWEDCVKKSPHQYRQQYNLGVVLAMRHNDDDAIRHYRTALRIKPNYPEAYYNLGNALARKGDAEAAIYNYRKALQFNPSFSKAYYNIARVMSNQGKTGESIRNYQKALIINSEMTEALYNLSWIYATSENGKYRNGEEAVRLAEKLCILTGYKQPLALDALAAAYAENGKFDKAVLAAQKAFKLAFQLGLEEHVIELKKRLKFYQSKQPYRQTLKRINESKFSG
jgi:tetratricopeptide (TPR) repeat protein